jgi:hypothetical protein
MRKKQELSEPSSCLNRATETEMLFVLLGRDTAAPHAIEAWCAERIRQGKNELSDSQIQGAYACAMAMRNDTPDYSIAAAERSLAPATPTGPDYERDYVLPCFAWAKERGMDLQQMVFDNPGKNCVELLIDALWNMRAAPTPEPTGAECGQTQRDNRILEITLDPALVYYGPHKCEGCGELVCRLALESGGEQFDYPSTPIYPNTNWTLHRCTLAAQPGQKGERK